MKVPPSPEVHRRYELPFNTRQRPATSTQLRLTLLLDPDNFGFKGDQKMAQSAFH